MRVRQCGAGRSRTICGPSHDLSIVSTHLGITPEPSAVRWMHDLHGNSVAVASFDFEAIQLRFESEIVLEHFDSDEPDCPIEAYARVYPFRYASDEIPDLSRSIELQYPDPLHAVDEWAKSFIAADGPTDTWEMLGAITRRSIGISPIWRATPRAFRRRPKPWRSGREAAAISPC